MNNVLESNGPLTIDEAAEAFLDRWNDDENPAEGEAEIATSDIDNVTENDGAELSEEDFEDDDFQESDPDEEAETEEDFDEDEEDGPEAYLADDESLVEITVNGTVEQVSVKDLKRLHGQEASLTRKSQDLAAQRKATEAEFMRTQAAYSKMLERAESRLKPYQDLDMLVASQRMDPDTFAQLRADAKAAEDDVKFLKEEHNSMMAELQQEQQAQIKRAAQDCVRVLEEQLPDWGSDLYQEIRNYAVASGLPQEQVDQYVDPNVIILLNKARMYDQSKTAAQTKKAKAKVVRAKGKTKVLSSKKAPPSQARGKEARRIKAQQKLRENPRYGGDMDTVAEALMARWED